MRKHVEYHGTLWTADRACGVSITYSTQKGRAIGERLHGKVCNVCGSAGVILPKDDDPYYKMKHDQDRSISISGLKPVKILENRYNDCTIILPETKK